MGEMEEMVVDGEISLMCDSFCKRSEKAYGTMALLEHWRQRWETYVIR